MASVAVTAGMPGIFKGAAMAETTASRCTWMPSFASHPAFCRVIMRNLDVGLNVDGIINMLHDYTQVGS